MDCLLNDGVGTLGDSTEVFGMNGNLTGINFGRSDNCITLLVLVAVVEEAEWILSIKVTRKQVNGSVC